MHTHGPAPNIKVLVCVLTMPTAVPFSVAPPLRRCKWLGLNVSSPGLQWASVPVIRIPTEPESCDPDR
jgi:hypothetical protein